MLFQRFSSRPDYIPLSNRQYGILESFRYKTDVNIFNDENFKGTVIITIPKGFITDLATVPKLFWSWLPPDGNYRYAAIIHDFILDEIVERYGLSGRYEADLVFLEAMRDSGVSVFTSALFFSTVRLYAGFLATSRYIRKFLSSFRK